MNDAALEVGPVSSTFSLVLLVAGIYGLVTWIRCWWRQGYVLPYEPRRRPPWGALAGLLAVVLMVLTVMQLLATRRGEAPVAGDAITAEDFAAGQFQMTLLQLAMTAGVVLVLVAVNGAGLRDLGLPTSGSEWTYDIGLGLWVLAASLLPVYAVQAAAIGLLGIPPGHPLLDQMAKTPDPTVFVAAMVAAVTAAPLFEELVFRLLLQGGLERAEDERIGWTHSLPSPKGARLLAELRAEAGEQQPPGDDGAPSEESDDIGPRLAPGSELYEDPVEPEEMPLRVPGEPGVLPGLAHGWAPILASSLVFALAHLGSGPSPIPLFVFAMFLGYVYQRTHRIVPAIVAHVVFNLISVTVLMLMLTGK